MRRVVVLGCTGSIGRQALDVVQAGRGAEVPLKLVGVSAGSKWQEAVASASAFDVRHVQVAEPGARLAADAALADLDEAATFGDAPASGEPPIVLAHDVAELLDRSEPDVVLNSVVGFAGLDATLAALERGIDVALANKESLVAAGELCMATAERTGAAIIPVDSEHSAMYQCLVGSEPEAIESLVLTASGGPFRGRTRADLEDVGLAEALDHPTWSMGGKITIDSATLMNKGLELIEAMVLFGMEEHEVETVVHPHSIVHALVRHVDGSLLAHLGWPDMRVPIAWALHHPRRAALPAARRLDLVDMPDLTFEAPDLETFRCLALAREAARAGGGAPCVLNAANEVAVAAFMEGRIGFLDIDRVVEHALGAVDAGPDPDSLVAAAELDALARRVAGEQVAALTG